MVWLSSMGGRAQEKMTLMQTITNLDHSRSGTEFQKGNNEDNKSKSIQRADPR